MDIHNIPVVSVSYNTPALLDGMLRSLRKFYRNPVHVIDGSDAGFTAEIAAICAAVPGVTLHAMGFNIHHGPGLTWALQNLGLNGQVLFLDSDIVVLREGFIEALRAELGPGDYAAGGVCYVNQDGFVIPYGYGAVPYLHPACMLCNAEVVRQWPLPTKHGAPTIDAMNSLHRTGQSRLLRHLGWTANDVAMDSEKRVYIDHVGMGTIKATGGYHLEEWMAELQAKRKGQGSAAAPPAGGFNADLLALMPPGAQHVLEVGCSTGAMAHAFKTAHPGCNYQGIEIDERAAEQARHWCDGVAVRDMDALSDADFDAWRDRDCWVFGDVLEHLRDPAHLLARIRRVIPAGGCIVASVPNVQHWSVQARLSVGDFRYADGGLMDRTHIRWFTRITLLEMLAQAGWKLDAGVPRIFDEPQREKFLPALRAMATAMGADPEAAVRDALPLQYVVRAVPA